MYEEYGHISEEVYNQIGFPPDTNYEGEEVDKPDGISQEMRHRAKILSHELQQKLRKKKEDDAIAGIKEKDMHKLVVAHDLH